VPIVVGHSHSFDAPARRARALIEGGGLGAVRMIQALNYTDFLYRPRRPEELDTARGGGAVFNQAPHQVDVACLLGGGLVRSGRAARAALRAAGDAGGERVLRLRRADRDPPDDAPVAHEHFGPVIVSCDSADLRLLPDRVEIHADADCRIEMPPPPDLPRRAVLDTFHAAIHGASVVQSGAWGMATLEVCLAILQSGREGREITLAHQIGVAAP
jgi:phthalate 4,5-cis-dihydrodiol dehydrogenase